MPDLRGDKGLVGESAKEAWLPDAMRKEHERQEAEFRASFPKGTKMLQGSEYHPPWVSIAQAPTEENIRHEGYGGSA